MHLESTIFILRAPEEVQCFLGDISNIQKWDRGVASAALTSAGPMGLGSEFETIAPPGTRDGAGTQGRMSYRIAEADPEHCVVELTSSAGNARFFREAQWSFRVKPAGQGSLLACSVDFKLRLRYIVLAPVLFFMRGAIRADLRSLKRALEAL